MAELKDLVQFALDKQPSKFKDAFGELVTQRVVDRVDELKAEVAANMFGEAPESDDDEDFVDDDIIDDEDLEEIEFDDEDIDLDEVEEDDLLNDDDDYVEDEDDIVFDEDEFDDVEESFNEEGLDALKEETHYLDSMERRDAGKGHMSIGVRDRKTNRITGYVHVGPKVDANGKRSMFGNHHELSYHRITKDLSGEKHDLGRSKFSSSRIEKQISDIHAQVGK